MNSVLTERPVRLPLSRACLALGLSRSSVYARLSRAQKTEDDAAESRIRKDCIQPRALSELECDHVLHTLNNPEFCDQTPYSVYMSLLDRQTYLCSVSTMHRILRKAGQNGERRNQRPAQHNAIPRLYATAPNQVWTWDVTKLKTRQGEHLSMYVVLDLFSRYVLAWMISPKENSTLSMLLFKEAHKRYHIKDAPLTIHQDRGVPMTAREFLDLIIELGITPSHSRPRTSNDNPFSESQFKTMKYRFDYPGQFDHLAHSNKWGAKYIDWYNTKHHHSGLAGFTPEQVFTGRYEQVAIQRKVGLSMAYEKHPERFSKGHPVVKRPPIQVAINPLKNDDGTIDETAKVNFPTLTAAKIRMEK